MHNIFFPINHFVYDSWFDAIHRIMLIFGQWPEVESLINELQKIEGIESVSKGRFFKSPGLAPTFQVWIGHVYSDL